MPFDDSNNTSGTAHPFNLTVGVGEKHPLVKDLSQFFPEEETVEREEEQNLQATMLDTSMSDGEQAPQVTMNPSLTDTLLGRGSTVLPRLETKGDMATLVPREEERYQPLGALGEGGAGEVVLVRDRDIERKVAMKRLKHQDQALQVMRFVSEVQTIGKLEHPNIVPIHDVGINEEGQYYFTMKYVEGETLREIIDKLKAGDPEYHKKYTFERRSQLFAEILKAILFAHDHGYIHRDIKPDNIMVGPYGEVQVMDWGIAKKIRSVGDETEHNEFEDILSKLQETLTEQTEKEGRAFQTEHGAVVGTPMYMSPEQTLGANQELNEKTDIYSLSVMFYEFLTLHHYLETKKSLQDVLFGILQDNPVDPEKLKYKHQGPVPRELCFFLRKGYGKKPEERFGSVREMLEELQANLEGRICVYCPSTFLKRGAHGYGHYLDNHRILGVVWVCLGLIIFGVGLFAIVQFLMGQL